MHTYNITYYFFAVGYTNSCYWIGGYRGNDEQLYWLDGRPLVTTEWNDRQPDDYEGKQDCVQLLQNSKFNDKECSDPCAYICELI
jgi:hypothetical protein